MVFKTNDKHKTPKVTAMSPCVTENIVLFVLSHNLF